MYKRTNIVNINKIGLHRDCLEKIDKMHEKFVEEEKNNKILLSDYNKENQELKKNLEKVNNLLKKYNMSSIENIEIFLDSWITFCKDYNIKDLDDVINKLNLIRTDEEYNEHEEDISDSEVSDNNDEKYKSPGFIDDNENKDENYKFIRICIFCDGKENVDLASGICLTCQHNMNKKLDNDSDSKVSNDDEFEKKEHVEQPNIETFVFNEENDEIMETVINNNKINNNEEKVINKHDKCFENIINKYHNYENHYYPKCVNNTNINANIEEINVSINKKDIENANIVYNLSIIYNKYLHDNKEGLTFEGFIEYNKDNYKFIDISNTRIKDRYKRCYKVLENILQHDKNKIINILTRLKLSYSKIYKLLEVHREKLNLFILDELGKKDYKNIYNSQEVVPDLEIVKTLIQEIPFSYIGNKKSIVKELLNVFYQAKNEKINTFIELYSGSMVLSYIIKHMLPNIKIHCYENNPYLINFYKYIKHDVAGFILDINNKLEIINKIENIDSYIKNILKKINNLTEKEQSIWYFISINISHCNMLSYKTNGFSSVTFNEKEFNRFKNKCQKDTFINNLNKYSEFINKIEIHDININENYNEILKTIGNDTITYIDPPYYGNNTNKLYYSNFTITNHVLLWNFVNDLSKKDLLFILSNSNTVFINNLYNNFNIKNINVNSKIKSREELIITNFNYKLNLQY